MGIQRRFSIGILDRLIHCGILPIDRRVLKLKFDIPELDIYERWKQVLNLELGDVKPILNQSDGSE